MSMPVANVPRREYDTTSRSTSSRFNASRTGVRPMPSDFASRSSSIGSPGWISSMISWSRMARYALSASDAGGESSSSAEALTHRY